MRRVALHLGPLRAEGYKFFRSGLRWLCAPGETVRPNQVIAYCNISLQPANMRLGGAPPFAEEQELQIAFAPRLAGRIAIAADTIRGGFLNIHSVDAWDADDVIAHLETEAEEADKDNRVRLLMLAGRRMSALADVHSGLLPSWYGRSRGWWCEEGETPVSLLSLGICDATGVVIGDHGAFLETFEAARMPAQMVFVPDHPVTPTAQVLVDQITRTPAQNRAIAADMRSFLSETGTLATAEDWTFAGFLLQVLQQSPIRDSYTIYGEAGLQRLGPAEALLLSLNSEPQAILRHRKLGFPLQIMRHHQAAAGPAIRAWLGSAFETVRRSIDDIKRDYEILLDTITRTTGARVMIINRMSTQGHEDISSYAPFDAPMSATLANIASKELNLMLHDIAETRDLAIIDVDAIAADIGGAEHLPDNIHQSGPMQAVLRAEILHVLEGMRPRKVAAVA